MAALVTVAARLVEAADEGARLELGGAVADATAEETEAMIELVDWTTLEVSAAALLEEADEAEAEADEAEADETAPVGDALAEEAPAPRQLESELL